MVTIEEMQDRIEAAQKIKNELEGRVRDGLSVENLHGYTIVDDGQDIWIATDSDYDEAIEEIISDVLENGHYIDDDECNWYSDFCSACDCLYTRCGYTSDIPDLLRRLETPEIKDICEALCIENEDICVITITLIEAGDRFSGNNPVDTAEEWISEGFNADDAEAWISVGFWNPQVAAELRDIGIEPDDAQRISEKLIEDDDEVSNYTDGDPIYSLCNNDTDIEIFIKEFEKSS